MATATGMAMGMDMTSSPIRLTIILSAIVAWIGSSLALAQQTIPGSVNQSIPGSSIQGDSGSVQANSQAAVNSANTESGATPSRAIVITPRILLTETWSDNVFVGLSNNGKQSGFITQLMPGVHVDANTARLKAYFDYALIGQYYSTGNNRTQNSLNTFGTLEAVSNWLFLDFSGLIGQQAISAFGAQSPSNANINSNITETSTYRLSPYIRGQLSGIVEYLLRYNWSTTTSGSSTVSDIVLSEWAGQLRGSTPFQNLKWSIDASQQTADYSLGRTTDAERLYAMATYTIVPQLRASVSGGQESNNYASQNTETHPTHGYGFDWSPTERTAVSAFKERRFFGNGHRYSFSHRFPLSSIRYSDTRDVSVLPNQFTSIGLGTVFDLYRQICSQQLSSVFSDPNQLDQAANACANAIISQSGISPNAQVTSSFLSSRATIQRIQQLALAIQGASNTLTVLFNRNQSESILAATAIDNFNNSSTIRQRGVSINLSHQLNAVSSANLMASRQKTIGLGINNLETNMALYQATLTSKIGAKTTGSISIRRTEFDSTANPYTENAIVGTISVVF